MRFRDAQSHGRAKRAALLALVPLALATVALVAGYVPARRALSVDPTVAMRSE